MRSLWMASAAILLSAGMAWAQPASSSGANDAAQCLQTAQQAIAHHDRAKASEALSQAETRLLTRAVPQTQATMPDQSPAIAAIERARKAVEAGDYTKAAKETAMAMGPAPATPMSAGAPGIRPPSTSLSPIAPASPGMAPSVK